MEAEVTCNGCCCRIGGRKCNGVGPESNENSKFNSVKEAGLLMTKYYGVDIETKDKTTCCKKTGDSLDSEGDVVAKEKMRQKTEDFIENVMDDKEASTKSWSGPERSQASQDDVAAALFARALCLAKVDKDEASKVFSQKAQEFEKAAITLVMECKEKVGEERTKDLLLASSQPWGKLNCITLAVRTRFGKFLALSPAHKAVSAEWNGDIVCQSSSTVFWIKLYLAVVFPPMLFTLHYRTDDKQSESAQSNGTCPKDAAEKAVDHVKSENGIDQNGEQKPAESTVAKGNIGSEKRWSCCQELDKIRKFYSAPTISFRLTMTFYIAFLGLYSYMVLVEFEEKVKWSEIVIYIWLVTMVLGEINEIVVGNRSKWAAKFYISSVWNVLDVLCLLIFIVGAFIRPFHCHDCVTAVRVIYAVDLFIFYSRFLQILTVSRLLGPKLVMIKAMFKDLIGFFFILFTIVYGYAVATEAILYPNSRLTWKLPFELARKAYFQIFGELFLEEIGDTDNCTNNSTLYENSDIPRCPSSVGTWLVPALLGVYILLTNVLLLNLLIAMFTYTFERIQSEEKQHWNLERARLVLEYKSGPAFPPPLNVFCILYGCLRPNRCEKSKNDAVIKKYHWDSVGLKQASWQSDVTTMKTEIQGIRSKLDQLLEKLDVLVASSDKPRGDGESFVQLLTSQPPLDTKESSEA